MGEKIPRRVGTAEHESQYQEGKTRGFEQLKKK